MQNNLQDCQLYLIDYSLKTADKYDVQVAIHTDTLNKGGFVEHTIKAIAGRTIHTYHTEGAGGGHAPDLLKVASQLNCLPASTNPTKPFTINTIAAEDILQDMGVLSIMSSDSMSFHAYI